MATDEVQTGESTKYPSQNQQLCQRQKKRWNASTSVDGGIITSQAYCQQYVKRQRSVSFKHVVEMLNRCAQVASLVWSSLLRRVKKILSIETFYNWGSACVVHWRLLEMK